MKKYVTVLVMAVILLMTLPGCFLVGGGDDELPEVPAATPASIPALQSEINSLKTQVSSLSSQLASVSVSPTDTSAIEASIAVLQTQIADLTARLAVLEAEEDSGGSSSNGSSTSSGTWDTIRWHLRDVDMTYDDITVCDLGNPANCTIPITSEIEENVYAELHTSPSRIEDEDLYDVELIVANGNEDYDIILKDVAFVLTLSADGYAMLSEESTYLDSDRSPYLLWEADFTIREREGKDVTRRVTFESDELAKLEIEANDYETLDLVLELYYE